MTTFVVEIKSLGERMRHAMRTVGLTGSDMAVYLGVSRNAVSEWLNGHTEPRLYLLRAWAERTGVPLRWLAEAAPGTRQAYALWMLTEQNPELRVSDEERLAYLRAHPDAAPAEELAELEAKCAIRDLNPEPAD